GRRLPAGDARDRREGALPRRRAARPRGRADARRRVRRERGLHGDRPPRAHRAARAAGRRAGPRQPAARRAALPGLGGCAEGKAIPGAPGWLCVQVRRAGRIFPLRSSPSESAVVRETPPSHGEYFGDADDGELVLVGGGVNGYLEIEPIPFVRGTRDLRVV